MAVCLLLNRCLKKARFFYCLHLIRKYLRHIRDEAVSKTTERQELIKFYYEWSPVIIKSMGEDELLKDKFASFLKIACTQVSATDWLFPCI